MPDLDPYNGRPVFFDCVSCGGKNGRSRKSPGSKNCCSEACKGVRKRRHEELEAVAAPALRATTTSCFKVKQLLGDADVVLGRRKVQRALTVPRVTQVELRAHLVHEPLHDRLMTTD